MSETIQFIIVFFLMMFVDYCWGHYIKGLNDGNGLKAGFFGAAIMLFGAFSTISYVENHLFLIPAILVGFIGTYYAAKHNKK